VRRLLLLLLPLTALVATACGGEDSGDGGGATPVDSDTVAETTTTLTTQGDVLVAQDGDMVAVHYIGTLDDGTEFDSSRPRGATLDFTVGAGQMIGGFDQAVRGMAEGETKTVRLEPADAYGEVNPDLIIDVQASQVPEGTQAGDVLVDPTTGRPVPVLSVEGDVVTLDLNHELAGQALTFEIEMVSISR
jgi:peptide-methionine (S)-S-oxide reductase